MKIVFFNLNSLDFAGGAEKYFVDLAKDLSRNGHEVSIVCNNYLYVRVRPRLENIIFRLVHSPLRHAPFKDPRRLARETLGLAVYEMPLSFHRPFSEKRKAIINILKQADVIYCKNEFLDSTYLRWLIGPKLFARVVIGMHTAVFLEQTKTFFAKVHDFLYFSPLYAANLRLCRAIHVVNGADKGRLTQRFKLDGEKIFSIPYGLKDEEFSAPKLKPEGFKIIFAGRFSEQKGVDYLEDIIERLSSDPDFIRMNFIIAGTGPEEPMIIGLTKRYPNVDYIGFIKEPEKMRELYRSADVAIAPSRWEMFPYNCLEPQALGVPVIAFDIPGSRDIVVDGVTGRLLPLGDTNAFAKAITELFYLKKDNLPLFKEIGENSWRHTKGLYSTNNILHSWLSLLAKVFSYREK